MNDYELRLWIIEQVHSITEDNRKLKEKLNDIGKNLENLGEYLANN